jgi:protein-L-isoaspartate(D-aspartate) O-methyltransferase
MDRQVDDFAEQRAWMVEHQIRARGVHDPAVLKAMGAVPRHEFVPESLRGSAYADHPLPIGEDQTISQPYIVALMTEALAPCATDRVLELGGGSGYQAAVLAAIVDSVFTIEYFPSLAREAAARLARLGYANVLVKAGDGWGGWPEHAPFDAAIITFATPDVPPAVVDQLRVGGRLCVPVGAAHAIQDLCIYTKQADGELKGRSLGAVRFVPVLGEGSRGRRE